MGPNGYQTYHDNYFIMDANVKSVCSIPETNIIQYINYIKKKEKDKCWQECGEMATLIHWWECKMV